MAVKDDDEPAAAAVSCLDESVAAEMEKKDRVRKFWLVLQLATYLVSLVLNTVLACLWSCCNPLTPVLTLRHEAAIATQLVRESEAQFKGLTRR